MEIKLAQTAGFCMGVRRAVDAVLDIAQRAKGRRIILTGRSSTTLKPSSS